MTRPKSQRQIAKDEKTRELLLKAALRSVGRVGYAKASIAKIADLAGFSTGTFYLHFDSKGELYDQLLPWANRDLIKFSERNTKGFKCYMEFEEKNIRSFFTYLNDMPAFLTVMIEAEVYAPKAWAMYCRIREADYMKLMQPAWERGEFPDFEESQLNELCSMMMSLRKNLVSRHFDKSKRAMDLAEVAIETYLDFVFGALHRSNSDKMMKLWRPGHLGGIHSGTSPSRTKAPALA